MKVYLQSLTGKGMYVEVDPQSTIRELKEKSGESGAPRMRGILRVTCANGSPLRVRGIRCPDPGYGDHGVRAFLEALTKF